MLTTFTSPVTKILHLLKIKLFAEQKMHSNAEKKARQNFRCKKSNVE